MRKSTKQKKHIVFIGGFELTKNSSAAHMLKSYLNNANDLPTLVLSKEECTKLMPSLSLHSKGVGLSMQHYLTMSEYLYLIKDKEYQQFIEIVKHIAETNNINIIATGRFVNLFSDRKWIEEIQNYFSLLNYHVEFYFVERTNYFSYNHSSVRNVKARKYFDDKVKLLRQNEKIIKINDENFLNNISKNIHKKLKIA